MLDWINACLDAFASCVSLLFDLPFYGSVSVGLLMVSIGVFSLVLTFLIKRIL